MTEEHYIIGKGSLSGRRGDVMFPEFGKQLKKLQTNQWIFTSVMTRAQITNVAHREKIAVRVSKTNCEGVLGFKVYVKE